jgi:hypothetical protein
MWRWLEKLLGHNDDDPQSPGEPKPFKDAEKQNEKQLEKEREEGESEYDP